jgi:signal transduction histidine kinase
MVILMTAAVVVSQILSVAIIQANLENLVASRLQSGQTRQAARTLRLIDEAARSGADLNQLAPSPSVMDLSVATGPSRISFPRHDETLAKVLRQRAGLDADRTIYVRFIRLNELADANPPIPVEHQPNAPMFGLLYCAIEARPGVWVSFFIRPIPQLWPPSAFLAMFLFVTATAVALTAFLIARRLAAPLRALARAAERLTEGERHEAVRVFGPVDIRRALTAFNVMGARLQTTVLSQRALLAAIGHDLRTPLTALRLRAELLADPCDRERITRALDELERLTEAALLTASEGAVDEPFQRIDLGWLVSSVCEDLAGIGMPVIFTEPTTSPIVTGWPEALTRAVRNVVENAVRYGGCADVSLKVAATTVEIIVSDRGPGIPEADHERVFEPLVRLETSRSLETGGHGLGLHIARNAFRAHGGDIRLRNRPGGGLQATIALPCAGAVTD